MLLSYLPSGNSFRLRLQMDVTRQIDSAIVESLRGRSRSRPWNNLGLSIDYPAGQNLQMKSPVIVSCFSIVGCIVVYLIFVLWCTYMRLLPSGLPTMSSAAHELSHWYFELINPHVLFYTQQHYNQRYGCVSITGMDRMVPTHLCIRICPFAWSFGLIYSLLSHLIVNTFHEIDMFLVVVDNSGALWHRGQKHIMLLMLRWYLKDQFIVALGYFMAVDDHKIHHQTLSNPGPDGPLTCMIQMSSCSNTSDANNYVVCRSLITPIHLNQGCWSRKTSYTCRAAATGSTSCVTIN